MVDWFLNGRDVRTRASLLFVGTSLQRFDPCEEGGLAGAELLLLVIPVASHLAQLLFPLAQGGFSLGKMLFYR